MENRFVVIVVSLAFVLSILCGCCMVATFLVHRDDRAEIHNTKEQMFYCKAQANATRWNSFEQRIMTLRVYMSMKKTAQVVINAQPNRKGLTIEQVKELREILPENQVVLLGRKDEY